MELQRPGLYAPRLREHGLFWLVLQGCCRVTISVKCFQETSCGIPSPKRTPSHGTVATLDHTGHREGREVAAAFLVSSGRASKRFPVGTLRSICNRMECVSGCFHRQSPPLLRQGQLCARSSPEPHRT